MACLEYQTSVDIHCHCFSAGHINITVPLRMTRYLATESDYVPWSVAIQNMGTISDRLVDKPTYQLYVVSIVTPVAANIRYRYMYIYASRSIGTIRQ